VGKTKTAFVGGVPEENKSGKAAYEEKRKRKEAEAQKEKKQVGGVGLKGGERIKVIGDDRPEIKIYKPDVEDASSTSKPKVRSQKYKASSKIVDKMKFYDVSGAIKLVKQGSYSKFDGSVELHAVVKKEGLTADVQLPHTTGRVKRIEIADETTIVKLKKGIIDFDLLLATPQMMPKLVPFAKLLGPKGLMPNPKSGTVIKDKKDIRKFEGNRIVIKTERKTPIVHTVVGKVSQKEKELSENTVAVLAAIGKKQLVKAYLSPTMGSSVKIDISTL
jgi:large subunit ribosomal protein L1